MTDEDIYSYGNKKELCFDTNGISSSSSEEEESDEENNVESDDDNIEELKDSSDKDESCSPPSKKTRYINLDDSISCLTPPPQLHIKNKNPNAAKAMFNRLKEKQNLNLSSTSYDSIHIEEDATVAIKVRLHGEIKKFTMNKSDNFMQLQQCIASEEGVSTATVAMYFKQAAVEMAKLLDSVTVADIIECIITTKLEDTNNGILIKIQTADTSRKVKAARMEYHINSELKLKEIMENYAKKNNVDLKKIKFTFDGDVINENDTPSCLDIEDGDIVDATFI